LPLRPEGIFAFWHQRILALGGVFHHAGFKALVSQHGDGQMLVGLLHGLGIGTVRGSTHRGGTQAIREILSDKGNAVHLCITPDGPRGPRHSFREGAIYIASRTGLELFPATVSFEKCYQLPTWDGFLLPRPFTRTIVRIGEGIRVPPDAGREEIETFRKLAEEKLRDLTNSTDENFRELFEEARRLADLEPVEAREPAEAG
jgi:lysophospholipid acyltransferase (LPLAT)-like uncharacterized protein